MKLNKIIGMTAALLVGAGMTSVVMADNDRGHRGGKRGEHAKRGQAGPPQQVIEMWKNRREAAQRGGRGPQVRGGFKGFGGSRGPQARGGQKGPRGPQVHGRFKGFGGSKGLQVRGGQKGPHGPKR